MKQGLVELVVIIDKSGSMNGLEKDVVGGFNSLIKEQKKHDGEVLVTTLLFDDMMNFVSKRVNINNIKPMTENDYVPSGCTALLDAIGHSISYIKTTHLGLEEENKPEHVIFSIMTDGLENSSSEYNYSKIKNMIKSQKKEGWDFLFQAANIDEVAEGTKIGISRDDIDMFMATPNGTRECFSIASIKIRKKINRKNK